MKLRSAATRPDAIIRNWATPALGLCFAVGAALRVWGIHRRPLWVDEALSILYATVDWADVVEMRRFGTNPPLYHFLLSGWVDLFGSSAAAIRAMSALLAIASMGVFLVLAHRLSGKTTALIATALFALSNLPVAYAQEARFYALTQFLSLVSSLLMYNLIERQRLGDAAGYVVATSALLWTHTYGWFVLAAQVVWLVAATGTARPVEPRRRRIALLGSLALLLVGLSFVPWIPILLQQVSAVRRGYWISQPAWLALPQAVHHMLVLVRLLRWPVVVLAVLLILRWAVGRARTRSGRDGMAAVHSAPSANQPIRRCHLWGLLAWMTLPLLIPFVWSKFSTPIFQVKYAIAAQAPGLILFAALLARRPVVGVAVLALLTGIWPPNRDRGLVVEEWPQAASILAEQSTTDATVFVYKDYAYFALEYYLKGRRRVRPVYAEGQVSKCFAPYYPDDALAFDEMMRYLAESNEQQTWFVLRWGCPHQRARLHARIRTLRDIGTIWDLRSVDVLRLVPRPAAHPRIDRGPTKTP